MEQLFRNLFGEVKPFSYWQKFIENSALNEFPQVDLFNGTSQYESKLNRLWKLLKPAKIEKTSIPIRDALAYFNGSKKELPITDPIRQSLYDCLKSNQLDVVRLEFENKMIIDVTATTGTGSKGEPIIIIKEIVQKWKD